MIFDNITGLPAKEIVSHYYSLIPTVFPDISQNGKFQVRYRDDIRDKAKVVDPKDPNKVIGSGRRSPMPTRVATTFEVDYEGERRSLRYLAPGLIPTRSGGQVAWPVGSKTVPIADKDNIDINADRDYAVWLLFFCDEVSNNASTEKKASPRFQLFRPAEEARKSAENGRLKRMYESTIMYDDTKHSLTYERVKEIMTILAMQPQGFEELDRKTLFDNVWANEGVRERFDMINRTNVAPAKSQEITAAGTDLIKRLRAMEKDGTIYLDGDYWMKKGKGRPTKLGVAVESEDPLFDFAEMIQGSPEILEKLNA